MIRNKTPLEIPRLIQLAVFGTAFLLLYLLLSGNNRLFADDFYYLRNAEQLGLWKGMLLSYSSWVTRWFSVLFLEVALLSNRFFQSLLPYHLVTIALFIFALNRLIGAITDEMNIAILFTTRLLYSILLTASFFFFSFSIGEMWFWITSATMYLWCSIFFIAGLSIILKPGNKFPDYPLCVLSFLYCGGASESMAVTIFVLLTAGFIYQCKKNNFVLKAVLNNNRNKMLLVGIASIIVSLLITYVGPGRAIRQEALPHTGILQALLISLKSLVKLLLFQLPLKIHWFVFFSIPWIYLGHIFSAEKKESLEKVFKKLIGMVTAFLLLSFISFIPVSFLLGETGPFRTWILISLFLSVCCAACGFYLGYKVDWNKKMLNRMFTVSLTTLTVLMIIHIIKQNEITSKYASAVDQRMNYLGQLKEKHEKNVVELEPLPPSGMLYSAEISEDTTFFSNLHLKNYFELECNIRKK